MFQQGNYLKTGEGAGYLNALQNTPHLWSLPPNLSHDLVGVEGGEATWAKLGKRLVEGQLVEGVVAKAEEEDVVWGV